MLGTWEYELEDLELLDEAKKLLDSTGKTAAEYKKQLQRFVEHYGYYFINSYQIYGAINATWAIQTKSEIGKRMLAVELNGSLPVSGNSLQAINDLTYKTSSRYTDRKIDFSIKQVGLKKTSLNPKQADEIIDHWDDYIDENGGAIGQVNISNWSKIPAIGKILDAVPETNEFNRALKVLEEATIPQVVWNEISIFVSQLSLLKASIDQTIDKPYENGYWGFMMKQDFLPIDSLKKMKKLIDEVFYNIHLELKDKNILATWNKKRKSLKKSLWQVEWYLYKNDKNS